MAYTQEDVLKATRSLTGKTIPVHIKLAATQVVLSQPEMRELLSAAETIAVGACVCREEEGNCDNPVEACLALDVETRKQIADCAWRVISLEEALDLLEETYRLGLVHMAYRRTAIAGGGVKAGEISFVCSCCTCCCWPLTGLKRFDYHDAITESAYVARYDEERCIGCGACVTRCPFDAFALFAEDERVTYSSERCFGCGLCVGMCLPGAIALQPRSDS